MKAFSIIPTDDELASVRRDPRFDRVDNNSPSALTGLQTRQVNEQGYVAPISVFSAVEIDHIRDYFNELLAPGMMSGGDSHSISSAHLRYGPVYDIPTDSRIVDCVRDLLLHGSEANTSSHRRSALTLRYCSAEVRASLEWNQKGVHVCGSDPSCHWSNQPRPTNASPCESI